MQKRQLTKLLNKIKKSILILTMSAIVFGGMMMFASCDKEIGRETNPSNIKSENTAQNPPAYLSVSQLIMQLTNMGYVSAPVPATYTHTSLSHTVLYYQHSNGNEAFLHVYTDPVDASNDNWTTTCDMAWIPFNDGSGGTCEGSSTQCRVDVIETKDGLPSKWVIICCD